MKMPKAKDVARSGSPKSYLTGWFSVTAKGGNVEARQLADKWLAKHGDKLDPQRLVQKRKRKEKVNELLEEKLID